MALNEDSAVMILRATGDGYFVSLYQYDTSPPPPTPRLAEALESNEYPPATLRLDRVSADKTELLAELTTWVNSLFDQ